VREVPRNLETMPVLVTKADVLDHLAKICDQMAVGIEMASMLIDLPLSLPRGSDTEKLVAVWKSKLPAPDLQIEAARSAGKMLSHLASEERIVAARTAAGQTREPTRG